MSVNVIGVDPSLRRTGLARVTLVDAAGRRPTAPRRLVQTKALPTIGHRGDDLTQRCARMIGIAAEVMSWSMPCQLVVIEGPSYRSAGGLAWDRAGLWWRVVTRFLGAEVPVAVVPPTCRAKWATGNGAANKTAVQNAIGRMWAPAWPQASTAPDHNESDALALASMGASWLGLMDFAEADNTSLTGAAWPSRAAVEA